MSPPLHPIGFWVQPAGGPTVSLVSTNVSHTLNFATTYAQVEYNSSGAEASNSGGSQNYNTSRGNWLDDGNAADAWFSYQLNSGTALFSTNITLESSSRVDGATSRNVRVRDTDNGASSKTSNITVFVHDAATGGNEIGSATYSLTANYWDTCPGCCFTPWTLITLADGSKMPIVDVMVGDLIRVEGGIEAVSEIITRGSRVMYTINFADGRLLEASEDHPLYVDGKGYAAINPEATIDYKYVGVDVTQLLTGDKVLDQDGNLNEITSIVGMHYPKTVYTFGNAKFFANGLLVY